MSTKMSLRILFTLATFALSISAQVDGDKFTADFRMKFGPPIARETFVAPNGVEMTVDYAANGHVCMIHLPPVAPSPTEPGVKTGLALDEFVAELVPLVLRGKELGHMLEFMSRASQAVREYENVTISESLLDSHRTGVTVAFKNETCRRP